MRILHAISSISPNTGGPAVAVLGMGRAVAALGHDVVVHTTDHGSQSSHDHNSGPVGNGNFQVVMHRHIPPGSLTRHASIDLWRALATEIPQCDVVHLHSLYMFHDWVVWRECKRSRKPYLLRPHGTLDPYIYPHHRWRKWLIEKLFQDQVTREATLIHFTSETERELAQPFIFGRPGVVVPLGIEMDNFSTLHSPNIFRERYAEIKDRRIILFLGRLNFKKGLEILIPAFKDALAQRDDLHLVIAGPDGGYLAKTKELIQEYELSSHTTFTGSLNRREVAEAYAGANLFVLPSHTENFGIAAAEAMASGVPSILSDQVQIAAKAAQQGACWMEPLKVSRWANAILQALSDPEAARRIGGRGRYWAHSQYDWSSIGKELVAAYTTGITMNAE